MLEWPQRIGNSNRLPVAGNLQLLKYPDGSWAVHRDGISLGIWEHNESDASMDYFMRLAAKLGLNRPEHVFVTA